MADLTRARIRDEVRRLLDIVPPADDAEAFPDAKEGDEPDYARRPSNALLNQLIEDGVSEINLDSGGLDVRDLTVSVAAQTADGAYRLPLDDALWSPPVGSYAINEVRDAWWTPTGGTVTRLWAASLDTLAKDRIIYQTYAAGTPTRYAIEGYAIHLIPGPSTAGTLSIRASLGVRSPGTDTDTLRGMPGDCMSSFVNLVAFNVCQTLSADAEFAAKAQALAIDQRDNKARIIRTLARLNGRYDGHATVATYRRGGALRRG